MIFTNKFDLPHEVFEALTHDDYDAGESDYSVTTLLNSPRIVQLTKRHWDEIEEDAIDRLWSLFGRMAHNIFEHHVHEEGTAEERLYATFLDRIIGGKYDNHRNGLLSDFKITSSWTLVYGSRIKEWEEQLNIYAYLLRKHGNPVSRIRINCILRDWDKNKAKLNEDYPQKPIQVIPLTVWPNEDVEKFITERVEVQKAAEDLIDKELPFCTAEEMWEQPSKYAIMKKGGKRAFRVFDSEKEMIEFACLSNIYEPQNDEPWTAGYYSEVRLGKRTRCEDGYCNVAPFCNQYQEYLKSKEIINE